MTLRVKALAWFGLTGALFFTGALMIGGGIAGTVALHRIQYETATTVGTLTKTGICGKATTDGTATFTVAGTTYNARAECNARVGDPVPVKYDPTDPAHNNDRYGDGGFWIAGAVFGLIMFLSAVRNAISLHRTPTLQRPQPSNSQRGPLPSPIGPSRPRRAAQHVSHSRRRRSEKRLR